MDSILGVHVGMWIVYQGLSMLCFGTDLDTGMCFMLMLISLVGRLLMLISPVDS